MTSVYIPSVPKRIRDITTIRKIEALSKLEAERALVRAETRAMYGRMIDTEHVLALRMANAGYGFEDIWNATEGKLAIMEVRKLVLGY